MSIVQAASQVRSVGPFLQYNKVHHYYVVADPPGPPEIQGYIEGETIRMGQTVSLTCVSYGGNPLATITWYRNDEMVDMSYTTSGRESRNMFTFVAASEDNNAKYSCEARNEMSVETMTAQIVLAVQCKFNYFFGKTLCSG